MKLTDSMEQTLEIAEKLGSFLRPGDIIFLTGGLGAGKTTFTKGIGLGLKIKRVINSPTFTIVKQYQGEEYKLNHIDLYRIENLEDFEIDEYIDSESISVIEWPKKEMFERYEHIHVEIVDLGDDKRQFLFNANVNLLKAVIGEL